MNNIIIFLDALGRTIIGELSGENPGSIKVKNPAVIHSGLNNEGKIQINLIPVFFREFQKDWNEPIYFTYNFDSIVLSDNITLQDAIQKQYESMWAVRPDRETTRKIAQELAPREEPQQPEVEKLNLFNTVQE